MLDGNKIHFILASVKNKLNLVNVLKELVKFYQKEYQLENFDYYYKKLAKANRMDTNDIPKNQNEKTNHWHDKG